MEASKSRLITGFDLLSEWSGIRLRFREGRAVIDTMIQDQDPSQLNRYTATSACWACDDGDDQHLSSNGNDLGMIETQQQNADYNGQEWIPGE